MQTWSDAWPRVAFDLDGLEARRLLLLAAPLQPDYSANLLRLAESSAERSDLATARRAANLALELYPKLPESTATAMRAIATRT